MYVNIQLCPFDSQVPLLPSQKHKLSKRRMRLPSLKKIYTHQLVQTKTFLRIGCPVSNTNVRPTGKLRKGIKSFLKENCQIFEQSPGPGHYNIHLTSGQRKSNRVRFFSEKLKTQPTARPIQKGSSPGPGHYQSKVRQTKGVKIGLSRRFNKGREGPGPGQYRLFTQFEL